MPECPFCKEKVGANDFLPSAEAACSACGHRPLSPPSCDPWWLSAPPLETLEPKANPPAPPPQTWWTTSTAPEQKELVITPLPPPEPKEPETPPTVATPSPPPPRMVPSPSRLPFRAVSAEDDDDEPSSWLDRLRNLDFGSVLAFLGFSVALLFVSFATLEPFIKPIAAVGLLAGLLGSALPALWRRRNLVVPLLSSMLCLLVLLFAGSWPSFSTPPPPLVTISLKQKGMAAHQAAGADDWVDASANAVKRGDVRVEIVSAGVAPVHLKGKSSATASAERYLTIRLRVSYEGVVFQQIPYEPWADRAASPSKNRPSLTDNREHTYAQKTFDPGRKVVGRKDVDGLTPGHQVKEVLVYPVPAGNVDHLRLLLPASAFGLAGEFRFQIPRSMIRGL